MVSKRAKSIAKRKTRRRIPVPKAAGQSLPQREPQFDRRFLNREMGWLEFNRRVLAEAEDPRNPLLERLRFVAISSANLDEFFMKRVGGLKRLVAAGVQAQSHDGRTPAEQLQAIRTKVLPMIEGLHRCFHQQLRPALAAEKVFIKRWPDLTANEKVKMHTYFIQSVFPILTPLSVDPGHPFPFISNLSTSLGIVLTPPDRDERLFARVKVPKVLPQWLPVEGESNTFISLVDVIIANIATLFPQMKILSLMTFRLTRNADSDRDEEEAEDLLEAIEEELRQRRFAEVVRLELGPKPDPWMRQFLMKELELEEDDVYELSSDLDFMDLEELASLNVKHLRFSHFTPVVPYPFNDESQSVFDIIGRKDRLVHHPYESFSGTVEKFIAAASRDPKVLAIKMTLYRTGDRSPFVRALIRAAEAGKQVVCLVELKARFDEERNIYWAQSLENAGVHVVYGVVGLKTHAKTSLVVRRENDGIRCYAHIGTGNYNVATSKLYTDFGLFTADPRITSEIVEFFHYLTGRSLKADYNSLLVAPVNMFGKFVNLILKERDNARNGKPAQIIAKFNNMEEHEITSCLYEASQAGVEISLIVRGFTGLKAQQPSLSQNIHVISVIGRFLEHSRVFYFRDGQEDPLDGQFFLGSADWMYRNLHARVEAIVPIYDRDLKKRLWEILNKMTQDHRQTWDKDASGSYKQRTSPTPSLGVQEELIGWHKELTKHAFPEDLNVLQDADSSFFYNEVLAAPEAREISQQEPAKSPNANSDANPNSTSNSEPIAPKESPTGEAE